MPNYGEVVITESLDLSADAFAASGGRALATADAPDVVLPDVSGDQFRLSSLRGQKALIAAWAPY